MIRAFGTRFLALTLSALPLAACDKATTADPKMPEFYVYEGKPYCLVEVTNADPDVAKRQAQIFDLLTNFYQQTQGWQQKMNVVGVDYLDFKSLTLVVYSPCTDNNAITAAIAEAGAINKNFTGKVGGDASLVSEAKVVNDNPGGLARFAHFNPDVDPKTCLMQYEIPANAGNTPRIANAVVRTAIEFHFPVADFATEGQQLFILLSRHCNQQDKLAQGMEAAFTRRGIVPGKIVVRVKEPNLEAFAKLMPPAQGPAKP